MSDQQTWLDLAHKHWPGISDDDAEMVLFNATCFPFGTAEQVEQHLIEKYQQSGGDPLKAVVIAMKELDDEFEEYRKRYADEA